MGVSMPLAPVKYSKNELEIIKNKLSHEGFNYESWSDDDLQPIKERIKNHYHSIQNTICPYCKQKLNSTHGRVWDIEHIIPRSHAPNFMFEPKNLCMSCVDCNSEKSNKKITTSKAQHKYPTDKEQFLIVHPHFDDYDENIIILETGLFYYPLKPKGRKTIEVCGLDRFYKFAGFGDSGNIFEKIQILSERASSVSDLKIKEGILSQIAAIAMKGVIKIRKQCDN